MCGINGKLVFKKENIVSNIQDMNNLIFHRGPDDEGVFLDKNNQFSISMGMRRLSIIDLKGGGQPMYSRDKEVVIVFNGEIYNYKALKNELENSGVNFRTNSDTEVILNLYLKYGVDSFVRLDGMYAFSIYDKRLKKIFITRDYFGEKPMYYSIFDGGLLWGSELKSLVSQLESKPQISNKALHLYFSLTYIPAPYTIYEEVNKLEPNTYIDYDIKKKKYRLININQDEYVDPFKGSFEDAKSKTKILIENSVNSRSVSDVPIGTFLSGGVDSSIVSYCLSKNSTQRINTFSIGFEKKSFDETDKSRVVAKMINSRHNEFILSEKSLYDGLDKILNNFDEPFADSSAIPTYIVSNKTSKDVKVALTGDGGDEVFGGYNKYHISKINKFYTRFISPNLHKLIKSTVQPFINIKDDRRGMRFKIRKVFDSIDYDDNFYWKIISLGFKENQLRKIIKKSEQDIFSYFKKNLDLKKTETLFDIRNIDRHISLEGDMLVKVDRTSMLSSLECRSPFLNKRIWDFTKSLPENYLINKSNKKYILKEAFKDEFPENFLEKTKKGFGIPVGDWLRSFLKDELLFYSNKKYIDQQNLFHHDYIKLLIDEHLNGLKDNTFKVWTFFCFQKWYYNHNILLSELKKINY